MRRAAALALAPLAPTRRAGALVDDAVYLHGRKHRHRIADE